VKYKSDLSANWGNLHNRVIVLAEKFGVDTNNLLAVTDKVVTAEITKAETEYHRAFANFELFEAIQAVGNLASFANKYVADHKPWEKIESAARVIINDLAVVISKLAELYVPIMPETAQKATNSIKSCEKIILFPKLD